MWFSAAALAGGGRSASCTVRISGYFFGQNLKGNQTVNERHNLNNKGLPLDATQLRVQEKGNHGMVNKAGDWDCAPVVTEHCVSGLHRDARGLWEEEVYDEAHDEQAPCTPSGPSSTAMPDSCCHKSWSRA